MGTNWQSSKEYYGLLNQLANERIGGHNSPEMVMVNLNFQNVVDYLKRDDLDSMNQMMLTAAKKLEDAGADLVGICTNTLHNCYDFLQDNISIPIIHIADAVADRVKQDGIEKVLLLGTMATMGLDFYKKRLGSYGIEVIVPSEEDMRYVDDVIFNEMCSKGLFLDKSRGGFRGIIQKAKKAGAKGVVLGCTEIPILLNGVDCGANVYDTMRIHVEAMLDYSMR